MRKALALAALFAGSLVAFPGARCPAVTAAELPGKCLFWPALQKDCRAVMRQAAEDYRAGDETPLGRWANAARKRRAPPGLVGMRPQPAAARPF